VPWDCGSGGSSSRDPPVWHQRGSLSHSGSSRGEVPWGCCSGGSSSKDPSGWHRLLVVIAEALNARGTRRKTYLGALNARETRTKTSLALAMPELAMTATRARSESGQALISNGKLGWRQACTCSSAANTLLLYVKPSASHPC